MPEKFVRPADPALICPVTGCGALLTVVESGWKDPPALDALEPDVAVYTLECRNGHGRYEYTTGGSLRPIVG